MSLDLYQHLYQPATAPDLPTILALHGTGGNEQDLLGLVHAIAPGCGVLSLRGNVSERGMPRFFRRFAEGVFDLEDVQVRAGQIATFVETAASHYGFAANNIYALGYSNGANIAIATLLLHPRTMRGGILLRAMATYVPPTLPNLAGKGLFLSNGEHDPLMTPAQSKALYSLLQDAGASITMAWQPAQHGLIQSDVEMAAGWFNALIA